MERTSKGSRSSPLQFFATLPTKNQEPGTQTAFTLPELLVVITIIAILLGLLFGAIRTVTRYSRETITRGELANIEAAWKQYYNYYHSWPSNAVESAINSVWPGADVNGDITFEIGPVFARMLAGAAVTNGATTLNADGVSFLELTRFDSAAAPVSAWGSVRGQRFFVKLDANGDNQLVVPTDTSGSTSPDHTTNLFRRVAAWTANPDRPGILIGSWQQ